ncbi:MAG: chromate transporter [Acutalibacteraceae bacterium]|nr:chromate transporter [Acutalibacteraceae bacterium]
MSIFLELFLTFFKIGAFTFGGGYAMLPLIQEEVISRNWVPIEEFINFIAVSESTPGPFAINITTYIGAQKAGILGAMCSTLGVVLPSFLIILIVSQFYERFKSSKIVAGCMTGLRPAVIGLIGSAIISTALTVFFPNGFSAEILSTFSFISSLIIFAIIMTLSLIKFKKKIHPIYLIIISAVLGIASGYLEMLI